MTRGIDYTWSKIRFPILQKLHLKISLFTFIASTVPRFLYFLINFCGMLFVGEHMTEGEMAEYMSTLLGIGELGGSAETGTYDASNAAELLREHLPENITADNFAAQVLGFLTEGEGTVSTS